MRYDRDEIQRLMKEIRTKIYRLKTKRLQTLDCSDRIRLCRMLNDMNNCLTYLNHWQHAQCSIVLEACDIDEPTHPLISQGRDANGHSTLSQGSLSEGSEGS
jgi:hypothetical protein